MQVEIATKAGSGSGCYAAPAYWLLWAWVPCITSCTPDTTSDCTGRTEQAIINGSSAWDGGTAGANLEGIGYLRVLADAGQELNGERLCTVSRISRGWALTAAHCLAGADQWEAWIGFNTPMDDLPSPCVAQTTTLKRVTNHQPHPELDVDLIMFEDAGGPTIPVADNVPIANSRVVLVGFGLTEDNEMGNKRYTISTLVRVDGTTLVVDSAGKGGACVGDSGGPLLVADADGSYSVAGVLSSGSLSCRAQDNYVAAATVRNWIDETMKLSNP